MNIAPLTRLFYLSSSDSDYSPSYINKQQKTHDQEQIINLPLVHSNGHSDIV